MRLPVCVFVLSLHLIEDFTLTKCCQCPGKGWPLALWCGCVVLYPSSACLDDAAHCLHAVSLVDWLDWGCPWASGKLDERDAVVVLCCLEEALLESSRCWPVMTAGEFCVATCPTLTIHSDLSSSKNTR